MLIRFFSAVKAALVKAIWYTHIPSKVY